MIPQEIVDFIHSSQIGHLGSRDENLIPTIRRSWGTNVNDTKEILIVYVVQAQYEQMLKNFNDNGRVALTLGEWPSHRSYQFKGQFLKAREMTPDEVAFQQQYRAKPIFLVKDMGFSDEMAEQFTYYADFVIEFKVEKIYNQTPGPGAGKAVELAK